MNENIRWVIGIILTAASLAFGSNLYDRFSETREIAYELQTSVPRSGVALLRIVNPSAASCGPVTMEFTANANLKSAKFRKVRTGDDVQLNGRSADVTIGSLAARNGRVLIDFEYQGLIGDALEFKPADAEVGCGQVGYGLVSMKKAAAPAVSSRWIVVALLVGVILAVSVAGYWFDPFRRLTRRLVELQR